MKNWKLTGRQTTIHNDRFKVFNDILISKDEVSSTYDHFNVPDGIMIVPVKIIDNQVNFVFVEQYRYPIASLQLEFPGGAIDGGEEPAKAAARELEEETGYKAKGIKFIHLMYPMAGQTDTKMSIFMAIVEGEPKELKLDEEEKNCEFKVVVKSSDEVLEMIRKNEFTDSRTLAALCVALLQSSKAKEYLTWLN